MPALLAIAEPLPNILKQHYKIEKRLLKGVIFDNLKMIGFLVICFFICLKWYNQTDFVFESHWIWFFCAMVLVINVPSILLYLNYYFENKEMEFIWDSEKKQITIIKNGTSKSYEKEEIAKSTYHLGIYYKNFIDKAGRIPMMTSDFGYWDLQFKNGDRYFLTNILHNFMQETPMVSKTKYQFRFLPLILRNDSKQAVKFKEEREKTRTEIFIEKYQSKNKTELIEIIANENSYQKEAVEAAQIVLKNKTLGNKA